MNDDVLVRVEGVRKKFCRSLKKSLWYGMKDMATEVLGGTATHDQLRSGEFWAVNDVSFELRRGECLGLIGRNGAGKTTLLKMVNGLIKPDAGRITIRGRVGALIALGAGFNPILSGRENIYVNGSVLGLTKREVDEKLEDIIDFADIREFIDTPVQSYSSGMQVRLGFAVATALEPDVLLLDEVLAVGDATFRTKCFQRIGKILDRAGVIFVSHDAVQVSRICDYGLYLRDGRQAALGRTSDILDQYQKEDPLTAGVESLILDLAVKRFELTPKEMFVSWGDSFELDLHLVLEPDGRPGLCLIALVENETTVAQTDFTEALCHTLGRSSHAKISVGPIRLRAGEYELSLTILSETRKSTLVHGINICRIHVGGARGYGVSYQIPCAVRSV